jgi:hypothetical protein
MYGTTIYSVDSLDTAPLYVAPTAPVVLNGLFLSSRFIDRATVTASSVQGLLTANHVQTYRPDQVWRASGCEAEWLAWDFGEDLAVEAVVALAHNFSPSAMVQLRLAASADAVTISKAVDSGSVSVWPASGKPDDPDWPSWFSLLLVENATPYRYGRLDIFDPLNPEGYVQVGRLFAGPAFVPTDNVDINPSLNLVSPGEVVVSPFGRTYADDRGPPSRFLTIPISAIDKAELTDELFELQRYCGTARDFAFCLTPAATTDFHKFALQARFDQLQAAQAQPFWNSAGHQVWQTTLTLAEVL